MKLKRQSIIYLVTSFSLLLCYTLDAGTTGKLAGKVVDARNGEPLPGVNIVLEGTSLGASVDEDGQFFIINIPPGTYEVQALYIGYTTRIVKNVEINIDRTTQIDFSLEETVLEQADAIIVVAEKEIIRKDQTGSISTVGSQDIQAMPVQTINEVLNLQAGVIRSPDGIHVRGGRSDENVYMIDGVSITNLNGERGIQVETDAVQEMQLISGTFNAEYGKAMSGIINIVTKEGSDQYSGHLQASVGSFFSTSNTYSVMTTYGPGIDPGTGKTVMVDESDKPLESVRPHYDVRGTLSGPIPFLSNILNFFVSGRYYNDDGYIYGRRWYTPQGLPGDSALVPLRHAESASFQGKLTFRPSSAFKIEYSAYYNNSKTDHNTSTIYRYVPESGRQQLNSGFTHSLSLNHALSAKTFYDVKFSYFYSDFESYLYDDPSLSPNYFIRLYKEIDGEVQTEDVYYNSNTEKDAIVAEAKENGWTYDFIIDPSHSIGYLDPDENNVRTASYSFRDRYTPLEFSYNRNNFLLGKFDMTNQFSQHHLLKGGIEVRIHEIKSEGFTLRPKTDASGNKIVPFEPAVEPTSSIWHNYYKHNPNEISAYLQDKMEFDQLIVNIGLRFDYFDPDNIVPVDPADPDIYNPVNPDWKGPDWDEDYYNSLTSAAERQAYAATHSYTSDERKALMQKKVDPKTQFSPRLGIAYPISANGVIHASYGHFFQMPQARYLYGDAGNVRPDYKLSIGSQENIFGNADLNAESTVQYEIGLQAQIVKGFGLDVTLFYKDIRDWIGISPLIDTKHSQTTRYVQYENKDYANIQGITLAFEARPSNEFTFTLDYTYQVAEGTYSSPNDAYSALLGNEEPAMKLIYMDYDRRHSVNGILTYRASGWIVSMIGIYNTGFPYTPEKVAGSPQANYRGWRENIARKPSYGQFDLRVDKEFFKTGSFSHRLFLRIFNLFDQRGELDVHADTGTAQFTTYGTHNWVTYNPNRIGSLEHYYLNPEWYQRPREIQIGYVLNF
jgi:outer membrane receptor for ferrienterochelin and colicin